MTARKEKIKAMMDTDLEKLLIQVGDYDNFIEGKIKCHNCGKILNEDNIAMIVPVNDNGSLKLHYICDNPKCIKTI